MTQQTAVEWMFEQFFKVKWGSMKGNMPTIFEEAKEMEKEQMRECYENVFFTDSGSELKFEQYYNETYNHNK